MPYTQCNCSLIVLSKFIKVCPCSPTSTTVTDTCLYNALLHSATIQLFLYIICACAVCMGYMYVVCVSSFILGTREQYLLFPKEDVKTELCFNTMHNYQVTFLHGIVKNYYSKFTYEVFMQCEGPIVLLECVYL